MKYAAGVTFGVGAIAIVGTATAAQLAAAWRFTKFVGSIIRVVSSAATGQPVAGGRVPPRPEKPPIVRKAPRELRPPGSK